MSLGALQSQLEDIYGVRLHHRVDDFLITDAALAARLDTSENPRTAPEKLLVQEQGQDLWMTLYIASDVVDTVVGCDAAAGFDESTRGAFCTALEGVSHFLYLGWNAMRARSVTQLELELQAEVDKFVCMVSLGRRERDPARLAALHSWLFDAACFASNLSVEQLERYRYANRLAARYCQSLDRRYLSRNRWPEMYQELRRFYREGQPAKLRTIERPH